MTMFRRLARLIGMPLAALMLLTSMPVGLAHADLVTTDQLIERGGSGADRARIKAFIRRQDVREQMRKMGVNPDEAAARVMSLSNAEVSQIAGELDKAPAGEGVVGPILGAVLFVFIVLLITDLLCLTSVFPFTRCAGGSSR